MLLIKVEGPEIGEFIREHSSNVSSVLVRDAKERRKEGNGKQKNIRNVPDRLKERA